MAENGSAIMQKMDAASLDAVPEIIAQAHHENRDWLESTMDILVCIATLSLNLFSAVVVAVGIYDNGNFRSLGEPWNTLAAATLGGSMQIGVVAIAFRVFGPTGIQHWRAVARWAVRAAPAVMILSAVIAFEVFHSLVVQMTGAQGEQMQLRLLNDLARLNTQISTLDELIAATYEIQLSSHLKLAEDARNGRDDSGIAWEGPRYREQIARYTEATSTFGALAVRVPMERATDDANEAWQDVQARFAALSGKKADLETLFRDVERNAQVPRAVSVTYDLTEDEISRLTLVIDEARHVTPRGLAITGAFALVANARDGRLDHKQDLFALAYAIAPIAGIILFALYRGMKPTERDELRHVHRRQQKELDLYEKLGDTECRLFGARDRWYSLRSLNEKFHEKWDKLVRGKKAKFRKDRAADARTHRPHRG